MLTNYLKIAWRNLLKDRSFTFLNLAGLSTGLACAILIWLWVSDERRIDKFFQRDSQLFRYFIIRRWLMAPSLPSNKHPPLSWQVLLPLGSRC